MLLDTNAYSALGDGAPSITELVRNASVVSLALPVIAELRFGFVNGGRAEKNEHTLQQFLAQPRVEVLAPTLATTHLYTALHLFCKQRGRVLSQNDIWIAAIAQESGQLLVTYDKDFAVFEDILGDKLTIL